MKRTLAVIFALGAFLLLTKVAGAADYDQLKILQEIEYLKQKVTFQEIHIKQLKEAMGEKRDAKIEEKIGSVSTSKVEIANKFIDQLKIKGDLRVRFERRDREKPGGDDDARNRLRSRFRLGGVWKNKTESWEIGAGLTTGGLDATSTNDTWSENTEFETGDIRLDYAYAKHKINDFTLTLGQQKNPFISSWLFWDGDVRPAGLTVNYSHEMGFFATLGAYGIRFYDERGDDTAILGAGQVGFKSELGGIKYLVAAGYQHYDGLTNNAEGPNDDYEFQIGDFFARATIPARIAKISPYAHIWTNFGADGEEGEGQVGADLDPSSEEVGFVLGLNAKMGHFKVGYAYALVEADSIYANLKDADFGTGLSSTDVKGHKISIGYSFTENVSAGVTAMIYEANERDNQREVALYQFDMKYKF